MRALFWAISYAACVLDRVAIFAAVAFGGGVGLAWFRLVPALAGFGAFALGGLLSLVVAALTVVGRLRGRQLTLAGALSLAVSIVFVAIAASGTNAPPINDFTTDFADPPVFVHAVMLPANAGRDLGYPTDFAEIQRECCADLRGTLVDALPNEAFGRAAATARSMPRWDVTYADAASGQIEAVATTVVFGFQDDVVIRVQASDDGASRVDVRSKSRDGRGDIGANAARIRTFIYELEKRT